MDLPTLRPLLGTAFHTHASPDHDGDGAEGWFLDVHGPVGRDAHLLQQLEIHRVTGPELALWVPTQAEI